MTQWYNGNALQLVCRRSVARNLAGLEPLTLLIEIVFSFITLEPNAGRVSPIITPTLLMIIVPSCSMQCKARLHCCHLVFQRSGERV